MFSPDATLKDYYYRELLALRDDAVIFGRSYPKIARSLSLHKGSAEDPHVELLMQSFAWLTGRLHYEMEEDLAAMPNALMAYLQPHLESPVPCMTVAEIQVKPDGANFAKGVSLERGRQFRAKAADELGNSIYCRMRTTQETPLWPINVTDARLQSVKDSPLPDERPNVYSVLSITLEASGGMDLEALDAKKLRFYIDETHRLSWYLYDLLSLNLIGMALCGENRIVELGEEKLRWLGYEDETAALPDSENSHPGYRLLQEYFAFPAKFLFFEVDGLDFKGMGRSCQLLFLFNTVGKATKLEPEVLRLNCVPLVNFFPARIEPVSLDQSRYEYRISADHGKHRYMEIHSIEELVASGSGRPARSLAPWFALSAGTALANQEYFYASRREESRTGDVAGTETYLSFLDTGASPILPQDEVVGGRALCTNRRLPEQLRVGDLLQLEGPGPVSEVRVAAKPSSHHTPELIGARPWALAGQLSLNHLSLVDGESALAAFKSLLRQHVGPSAAIGLKYIDGIRSLSCRQVTRRLGNDCWRGFVSGMHIRFNMDRSCFEHASAVLFCSVLHHFLTLYANINSIVETSLETQDSKGILKQWQPLYGAQPIL